MPELPEVETTRRGLIPHVVGQVIDNIDIRQAQLRFPVPISELGQVIPLAIKQIHRRAKYLLFETPAGHLIIHLGMSGRLCMVPSDTAPQKHDHVDCRLGNGLTLRYHDPRRFGAILWTASNPQQHPLLAHLGPEPLAREFSGEYLHHLAQQRKKTVKEFIMDQQIVVGVGNIYAQEALFAAGIHPKRAACRISRDRYDLLVDCIKTVLTQAIAKGGTTLKDYLRSDGLPGFFALELLVYGRENQPCKKCRSTIASIRLGNRASCYCPQCQR